MHLHLTRTWIVSYFTFVALVHCDVGGTAATWLVPSTPIERSGFKPWSRTSCGVLGKTLNSHTAFSTQVYRWVPANFMLDGALALHSHPIQEG